ncbi:hypothetical protein [Dyadobacter sp. CY323]|uniref:hypothetical protein n=1 Tax=Dyadobacter sp. CY323 TaxID=2907302 RepID=UPI001F35FF66|nr:hypothetical protein [Dyadobacter sp. CY323]MCE6991410.1 hypothetical protein [Dyadobacter sp. CY323]
MRQPGTNLGMGTIVVLLWSICSIGQPAPDWSAQSGVRDSLNMEKAHQEIWRRFVDEHSILLDFTDSNGNFARPTADEFRQNKPNALGWWTPTENGAMFNGLYLDGICQRWLHRHQETDRLKASKLAQGLLLLASIGDTPGFIGRGLATDGKTPPSMGSNDQTSPWFYGLWRYLHSDMPSPAERRQIISKMEEVANILLSTGWRIPTTSYAPARFRNTFATFNWEGAPRMLFILKAMHQLTGEAKWDRLYKEAAFETGGEPRRSRIRICSEGMQFDIPKQFRWTGISSTVDLRALWEMETDTTLRLAYEQGLNASARSAAVDIVRWHRLDNNDLKPFLHDWRSLNQWWKPQHSEQDALDVSQVQLTELVRLSPRRNQELGFVREPLWMSWIVTLAPDTSLVEKHRAEMLGAIGHFRYDKLYYSQFFPAETVWFRLQKKATNSK